MTPHHWALAAFGLVCTLAVLRAVAGPWPTARRMGLAVDPGDAWAATVVEVAERQGHYRGLGLELERTEGGAWTGTLPIGGDVRRCVTGDRERMTVELALWWHSRAGQQAMRGGGR